jgi:selenocysteine lyase/cysteine desulfurase
MPIKLDRYVAEFPVTQSCVYLNHAAVSPLPRRVHEAMIGLLTDVHQFGSAHWNRWLEAYATVRRAAAQLLHAEPGEIAFCKNTSEGISLFANGLDWNPGDEVVSIEGEFPANYYPWKRLEGKGVNLRLVKQEGGRVSLDAIAATITPRTRVLAVSFVQYLSGFRLNLEQLGALCADRGVLFFVDAIQGLGAFPLDVKRARIAGLAADGHKWLLGPEGSAIFFVGQDALERIRPTTVGWMSVRGWNDFSTRELVWREDARRFESGSLNTAGIYGLGAALDLLREVGVSNISERILALTARLRQGLRQRGYEIFGPALDEECSGIVSLHPRKRDAESLARLLASRGVQVAARGGKVRVSPHFYNAEQEIDRVLDELTTVD